MIVGLYWFSGWYLSRTVWHRRCGQKRFVFSASTLWSSLQPIVRDPSLTLTQFCTGNQQGCGLGLDVSVSRRSRDAPTSRLGLVSRKIANVSVSSRSRAFTSRAHPCLYCYVASALTVSWWACRWRRTQCERILDVVSLCCSYYCSSY